MSIILQNTPSYATIQQGRHILRYRKGQEPLAYHALAVLFAGGMSFEDVRGMANGVAVVSKRAKLEKNSV